MIKLELGQNFGKCCDRISRRHALHLGTAGMLSGLTLPRLLAEEVANDSGIKARAKSIIFLFLEGGPPHQDMWDPKPDAPLEVRGPFQPISSSVPGTFVLEHCHRSAAIADKFTIVRSHTHNDNGHTTGYHYVMTGRKPIFADGDNPIPNNEFYPSVGSVVSHELGSKGAIPSYINIPHPMGAGGPGFYGAEHAPFVIEGDPSQPDFEVKDLRLTSGISEDRLSLRRKLLSGVERRLNRAQGRASTMSTYYEKAYTLITSPEVQQAFDITLEPPELRERYGMSQFGQCTLMARRLIEAGCRFVGVDGPGWDVHFNCFPSLKGDLIPPTDQAFSALINDMEQRGLLKETLVVMMGEMGRTPRVNAQAGRDHWSMAQTIIFAGAGIKPGQVIGATDRDAAAVTDTPVSISDLLRTIHNILGIDASKVVTDPLGRPIPLVEGGELIPGLLA
ncbi:MAG: DUF1501 domain-containing protein [Planctomycetaceae bacterium]